VQKEKQWIESGKYRFWEDLDLSLKKAIVKEVDRKTAEKIILEYEWLGDMAVTNKFYGIFFGMFCGGVICINTNGQATFGEKQFGLKKGDVSYFARGACPFWTPIGTASKILSFALKLEKQRGAKLAIAFADNDAGEYGTVYQATNWIYLGKNGSNTSYQLTKNNKILDTRTYCHSAKNNKITTTKYIQLLECQGWKKQYANPKGRYVFILADEPEKTRIYNTIKHLIKPYPKRPNAALPHKGEGEALQPSGAFDSTVPLNLSEIKQ